MANDASITITADANQAQSALRSLGDSLDGTSAKLMNMQALAGTLAGVLSVTAFVATIKGSIDLADSLNDLAKRTGATVEELAGLRLAAAQSGTSLEAIANGTKRLATSLNENEDAFKKLGIDTTNQTEALIQLGDVFAGMSNPVERSALAVKLFGKAGDEMIPLLLEGSDGIRRMIDRGQELAGVSTEMAKRADQFNDTLAEVKLRSANLGLVVASELLPKLNDTLEAFNDLNRSGEATRVISAGVATAFETIVVLAVNVGYVFKQVGNEIGGMAAQLTALAHGDFEGFKNIGKEMKADAEQARKDVDTFSERILGGIKVAKDAAAEMHGDGTRGKSLLDDLTGKSKTKDEKDPNEAALLALTTEAFRKQQEAAGDTAAQIKVYELVMNGATAAQFEAALAAQATIDKAMGVINAKKEEEKQVKQTEEAFKKSNETLAEQAAVLELDEEARIQRKFDMEIQRLEEQRIMLQYHNKWTLEQEAAFDEASLNAKAQADAAWARLDKQKAATAQQTLVSSLSTISSLMSSNNETLFEIGKVAAIANATISTYEGATKAIGQLGVWGIPVAAAIVVAGLANVATIAGTKIGGGTPSPVNSTFSGGSVSSGSDPRPITAPNAAVPDAARTQISIVFNGNGRYSMQEIVDGIVPGLREAIGNGVDLNVSTA